MSKVTAKTVIDLINDHTADTIAISWAEALGMWFWPPACQDPIEVGETVLGENEDSENEDSEDEDSEDEDSEEEQ